MIWDMHCHLNGVDGKTPDEKMANLMKFADRMGIERIVIFMGMPWHREPNPQEFQKENDEVLQALSHWHDRALGFVYLNPNFVEESLQELNRCVRDGPMVGVKLWVALRCNSEKLDPIVERAAQLQAVVFQHTWFKATGNLPGESTPLDLAALAVRHPTAQLICGHTGGDWEQGIRAVRAFPNVFIGISGFDPTAGLLEMAVRELGEDRIVYGSDAGGRSFASQLGKVLGADISDEAKEKILSGNIRRILRM
jgi:predicted TIM-barrel fold metal-dependent hydrolase